MHSERPKFINLYNYGLSEFSRVKVISFTDPVQWTEVHVRHWIQWAVKEFGLENVDVTNFSMNGQQLCEMSHPEFVKFIPNDKGDIFWTHLELLRKCKFVGR